MERAGIVRSQPSPTSPNLQRLVTCVAFVVLPKSLLPNELARTFGCVFYSRRIEQTKSKQEDAYEVFQTGGNSIRTDCHWFGSTTRECGRQLLGNSR
jgi:hypothetical protein